MGKVSIIVPAYNAEKTIGRCVESVLNQTYRDLELIVMDDGSKDGTAAILDEYAAQDARLRVVHKTNSGVSDTRNQGMDLATGDYLQFLDADDWAAPDATRLFVRAMEDNPTCDMVIADFYRVIDDKMDQKGNIEVEKLYTREEYADLMMKAPADFYYGVLWNKLFRRSIIEEFGMRMDVNLSWSEDFIFNMEYVLHVDQIYALKAPVYYYVKTEGSLASLSGSSLTNNIKMKLGILEYYRSFYKDICKPRDYYLRSPQIYGFLLNFARDGGVNSFAPEKRLGHDRSDVRFAPEMEYNAFAVSYQEDRMLENALKRFMKGNDLEEADAQILLYLKLAGGIATVPEVRNFTGLSQRALMASLQKLMRRKLIERVKAEPAVSEETEREIPFHPVRKLALMDAIRNGDHEQATRLYQEIDELEKPKDKDAGTEGKEGKAKITLPFLSGKSKGESAGKAAADPEPSEAEVSGKSVPGADEEEKDEKTPRIIAFTESSKPVQDALDRIFRDVEELELQDFTEEEKAQYAQLRRRAMFNVSRSLSEHVAKSTAAEGAAAIGKVTGSAE